MHTFDMTLEVKLTGDGAAAAAPYYAAMAEILSEIAVERSHQDVQWGGPAHDDCHFAHEWEDLIHKHAYRLVDCLGCAAPDYRQRLVKIAAIAVAAIQATDRLPGESGEIVQGEG